MKNFDLNYNLFENEISQLEVRKIRCIIGEQEGEVGWLEPEEVGWLEPDKESIDIIESQLDEMKKNINSSKKIILEVLNDKDDKYPLNVKLFYIVNVNIVTNDKNKLIYDGKVGYRNSIFKDIIVDYFNKNNFIYQNNINDIINSIVKNEKVEDFAKKLVKDTDVNAFLKYGEIFGYVIQDYINNNKKLCIEIFGSENETNQLKEEKTKIYNQKDFEKLSDFANKLGKDELNELQNILIQCEYDDGVLSDFTSAVDKILINKNVEENYMPVNTIMVYDTKNSWFFDISMTDKNGNKKLSFEKFVNLLNDYKNDNLIVVQTKLSTFKEFEPWENATIKGMFAVAKDNGNKLMDFVTVNVDAIKEDGDGQYNFKSIIDKDCYSYRFKTKQNVKIHFNKLEINEELKQRQGFYANEIQAQKIEEAIPKLK